MWFALKHSAFLIYYLKRRCFFYQGKFNVMYQINLKLLKNQVVKEALN